MCKKAIKIGIGLVAALGLYCVFTYTQASADATVLLSYRGTAIADVSVLTLSDRPNNARDKRGTLWNRGTTVIYVGWNKLTCDQNSNDKAGEEYLDPGVAMRIPVGCRYFAIRTATGTSKYSYIED